MSDEKNKNRLFITLQHRLERPGFHWSLLLFHAINSLSPGVVIVPGQKPGWRYESKPANVLKSRTITARILVAKLSGNEPVEAQALRIDRVISKIPLVQNDDAWTCRVWVEQALAMLRATGGEFGSIPVLNDRLGNEIREFAEKAKESILKGKVIAHPKDLAQLDLRGR